MKFPVFRHICFTQALTLVCVSEFAQHLAKPRYAASDLGLDPQWGHQQNVEGYGSWVRRRDTLADFVPPPVLDHLGDIAVICLELLVGLYQFKIVQVIFWLYEFARNYGTSTPNSIQMAIFTGLQPILRHTNMMLSEPECESCTLTLSVQCSIAGYWATKNEAKLLHLGSWFRDVQSNDTSV